MGIKDIIDVFDWPTACGSRLWKDSVARADAPVVQRLRQAGAVLIGKTVTTTYASFDPSPTRNPWKFDRTPGGSSSGSAAALACGMCLAALASQTGGSITRPASYCGVPGFKPSFDGVNASGVLTLAHSMDHIGAMAGNIHDVGLVMQVISEPHARPALAALTHPPRLGRLRGIFERRADAPTNDMMDRLCAHYASLGAEVVEYALPASFEEVIQRHRVIMAVEAAMYHEERLNRHPEDYPPQITSLLREGIGCSAAEYARAKEHQALMKREMSSEAFGDLDALICPATTRGAPLADTTGDPAFNSPWSFVQLVGRGFGCGGSLFAAAEWCEANREKDIGSPPLSMG
jgi:aspartyl-tRNA(Asn)/glutamyl-tRNA(Gln) amidotransferase subunit A